VGASTHRTIALAHATGARKREDDKAGTICCQTLAMGQKWDLEGMGNPLRSLAICARLLTSHGEFDRI
jgi:hypothetical protein